MMSKQSAVDWLEEQIKDIFYVAEASEMTKKFKSVYDQAKQMEKEQIVNAVDGFPLYTRDLLGDDYYNELYGGNNE